jgi:hypothetical protein
MSNFYPKKYYNLPKSFISNFYLRSLFTQSISVWLSPVMIKSSIYTNTTFILFELYLVNKDESDPLILKL